MFMLSSTADMRLRALHIEDAKELLHITCKRVTENEARELAKLCGCNATLLEFVGLVIKKQEYMPTKVSTQPYIVVSIVTCRSGVCWTGNT
jgi:hypothetical protein